MDRIAAVSGHVMKREQTSSRRTLEPCIEPERIQATKSCKTLAQLTGWGQRCGAKPLVARFSPRANESSPGHSHSRSRWIHPRTWTPRGRREFPRSADPIPVSCKEPATSSRPFPTGSTLHLNTQSTLIVACCGDQRAHPYHLQQVANRYVSRSVRVDTRERRTLSR